MLAACVVAVGLWFLARQVSPDVRVGEPLPAVRLADFEGHPVDLASYRGSPVLIDFWNSR